MLASGELVLGILVFLGLVLLTVLPKIWGSTRGASRKRLQEFREGRAERPASTKGKVPDRIPYTESSRSRDFPEDPSIPI